MPRHAAPRHAVPRHPGLLQSDKLYLACRGDSVGQVLEKQWAERPCTLVGGSLLTARQRVECPCLTPASPLP